MSAMSLSDDKSSTTQVGVGRGLLFHANLIRRLPYFFAFYLAYVTAGGLGQGLAIIPGVAITIWPPAGLLTGVLLKTHGRYRPWWLIAACAAELTCNWIWFHNPIHFALTYFSANAIEASITASITRRLAGADLAFESIRGSIIAILVGALLSPLAGALIIASTDSLIGKHAFSVAFPLTWLGDATGFLAVAPVTVALITEWQQRKKFALSRHLEAWLVVSSLTVVCVLGLCELLPTIYFSLPLALWAALRFQLTGASIAVALVLILTAVSVAELPVDRTARELQSHTIYLQCFLSITAISSVLVAALSLQYKNALTSLADLNTRLEERVQIRTAELAESENRLKQADIRKNQFLATLAHELRNPLGAIQSSLHLLILDVVGTKERDLAKGITQRQLQRMIRMVDDLLDVNRIALGKLVIKSQVVEVQTLINEAIEACQEIINEKHHSLRLDLESERLLVEVDSSRLMQVFVNLLTNAAKYTPAGGNLSIACVRDQTGVVVKFTDDGSGIPDHMINRVFDMFTQNAGQDAEEARGGLGIGLSLSKAIVELLGGSIVARSAGVNLGSQFEVRLPLTSKPYLPAGVDVADNPIQLVRHRILVVDDNRDAAESLALICRLHRHEVKTAHSGPDALECAGAFEPTIVLLDIGMPSMDGNETCRRMREQTWASAATIVALTGWGQAEDRVRSQAAGFDHHVVKPIEMAILHKLLAAPQHA